MGFAGFASAAPIDAPAGAVSGRTTGRFDTVGIGTRAGLTPAESADRSWAKSSGQLMDLSTGQPDTQSIAPIDTSIGLTSATSDSIAPSDAARKSQNDITDTVHYEADFIDYDNEERVLCTKT